MELLQSECEILVMAGVVGISMSSSISPCNVDEVELVELGLDGSLPSSIANLHALEIVD